VAGLGPAASYLHQARWGRPNLTLDLVEELGPLVVDAVVVRCATTGMSSRRTSRPSQSTAAA
jgi:CRISPR/Cas system-associated endonuclease Cas1